MENLINPTNTQQIGGRGYVFDRLYDSNFEVSVEFLDSRATQNIPLRDNL